MNYKAAAYGKLDTQVRVHSASPEQLIALMFEGAMKRLAEAEMHVRAGRFDKRSYSVNKAIAIIGGLQSSLNLEQGGEVAANLEALYDYMQRRLFRANVDNDPEIIQEVQRLLGTLRTAWDAMVAQRTGAGQGAAGSVGTEAHV